MTEPSKELKDEVKTRPRKTNAQGKKVPHGQSRDFEQPAERGLVRQSLLGWESARLWDVQGRIPARSRLVEELLRTSRSGLLGHREDYVCKELLLPNKKKK